MYWTSVPCAFQNESSMSDPIRTYGQDSTSTESEIGSPSASPDQSVSWSPYARVTVSASITASPFQNLSPYPTSYPQVSSQTIAAPVAAFIIPAFAVLLIVAFCAYRVYVDRMYLKQLSRIPASVQKNPVAL